MKIKVQTKDLKKVLDMVLFISKDAFVMKSRKANAEAAINAIFTAKDGTLEVESANEGVSYIKMNIPAEVLDSGKCSIDVALLSSFSFRSDSVVIEDGKDTLLLSSGRMKANMKKGAKLSEIEEALPEENIKTSISLPVKGILDALSYTIFPSIDNEIETTLPFILSTKKKGKVYTSSLDHFCTSLYQIEGFDEEIKISDTKCIPEGILSKVLKSTDGDKAKVGFSDSQFVIKTKEMTLMYPQPQYDLVDVVEAIKELYSEKVSLEFEFNPEELYGAVADVGAMGDTSDAKLLLKVDGDKIVCSIEGVNGKAKSFAKVKSIQGKQKEIAVVYNLMSRFAAQMISISDGEDCVLSVHSNIILIKTKDSKVVYTMPTMME